MRGTVAQGDIWRQWTLWHELRSHPELLEAAASASGSELQIQRQLRQTYSDALVRHALSLVELRRKAQSKFSIADRLWMDRQGLQQATAEPVARHKARRFSGTVLDLCCGIGADTLALADHCDVISVDRNPLACLWTQWNAQEADVGNRVTVVCSDAAAMQFTRMQVHIDPDRRANGHTRSIRVEDAVPGLEFLQELPRLAVGGAIKLSPASNFGGKFDGCEIELISLNGECKEATIWFGELAGEKSWRATVLPGGESLAGNALEVFSEQSPLGGYLYDPDPAVVRAGLVDLAAVELGLSRLDDAEEYLTGEQQIQSPFVRGFEVLADLPNNDKEIRRYFRQSDFGQLEVKCRHIPIQAESVRKKLSLTGAEPGVLIFARVAGKARAVVCRRLGGQ